MKEKNGYTIERFESIASTNDYAKARRGEKRDLIVIARSQTGGRGTKGRSFSSAEGGLYLTALTFYENFPAERAFTIMQNAAAAVCETLVGFGLAPKIKWPNDIYVNGKKICGILIENTFSGGNVASSIVGIGLNIRNELPEELADIATTVRAEGKDVSVAAAEEALIGKLCEKATAKKYGGYLGWLGEETTLLVGEEKRRAKLLGVDAAGALIAETEKGVETFASAEVSLRI
ncbi:MAG: biotin--[Clostridia bacterium]|nr:biotin--[acetyl-CoA-carboxylase] ligase [Clostridia bacterium]